VSFDMCVKYIESIARASAYAHVRIVSLIKSVFPLLSFDYYKLATAMLIQCFSTILCMLYTYSSLVWCPGQNKRIAPLSSMDVVKELGIITLTPEINCDQTAMG
jgi:hypothetical protein